MFAAGVRHSQIALGPSSRNSIDALSVDECTLDARGVAIPRAESQIVVRFGPVATGGLDVYVMGAGRRAKRKPLVRGQRAVTARVRLGMHRAVFGVSSEAIAGRVVPLSELWGASAVERLRERMAAASEASGAASATEGHAVRAAAIALEVAIAERQGEHEAPRGHEALVLHAVARLQTERVSAVADALGVSERHLRRVFREHVGMSPKEYARLARFHRALRAARVDEQRDWARIALASGYYDQAHLITEFRAISDATPRALMRELRRDGRSDTAPATGIEDAHADQRG